MAQETWGLKLDADLKEKVQEIIKKDFDSSKEFMEQLVSMYELHELKQGENVLTSEVEELESLTRRINGIFINANAKINTMLHDKDMRADQQVELKQKLIERLQGDIVRVEQEKEEISSINDSLVNSNTEYTETVNQLIKSNQTLEDLVTEYKMKNDTLTGLLAEYKEDREKNKSLQEQLQALERELQQSRIEAQQDKQALAQITATVQEQAEKHHKEILELNDKHIEELSTVKARVEIDANMRLLEVQQEFQCKVQALQDKHNTEIEQYQTKYKELLEKLEKKKTSTKQPKEPKTDSKA